MRLPLGKFHSVRAKRDHNMSRGIIGRSLASTVTCLRCRGTSPTKAVFQRSVSNSSPQRAEDSPTDTAKDSPIAQLSSLLHDTRTPSKDSRGVNNIQDTVNLLNAHRARASASGASQARSSGSGNLSYLDGKSLHESIMQPPHHLHVYATKHNTHITLTRPSRDPILSVAAGNIGFRKAGRGSYDAAYQLAAYVMGRIQEQGLMSQIHKLEVVLRGFGAGREAVTKALLGSEGRNLRGRVVRVTDATRLKFGGTRSPKPRRLG